MEVWDMLWGYFTLLWVSFYSTVISPRPMGVMVAPIIGVVAAAFLIWIVVYIFRKLRKWRWTWAVLAMGRLRLKSMSPQERARYLFLKMEEALEREIELLFTLGDITEDEKAWLYREFATRMGLPGLVRCYKEHLKREITERRAKGEDARISQNRVLVFEAQEKQRDKGITKANTLLDILGE